MREIPYPTRNGLLLLPLILGLPLVAAAALLWLGWGIVLVGVVPLALAALTGLFTVPPNHARSMMLFGRYLGTVRTPGFHWANPLAVLGSAAISLRARNFETAQLKVNDSRGIPIEIAAVVVWQVEDTAQALFNVDDYASYVTVQAESAMRHLAGIYPYDHGADDEAQTGTTLRGGSATVAESLRAELQERLGTAGVRVLETRLTHLAYAPEIASAMLRRQQADAVIAARTRIVQGAVGMVHLALDELAKHGVVETDPARRAALVGNLLVVLCSDRHVEPVINTGSSAH